MSPLLTNIKTRLKEILPVPLALTFFLGLLPRLLIVGHPGFLGDIVWWKWWALVASKDGLIATIYQTAYNYPPAYLYILKAVGLVYRFFAPPNIESIYWRVNDYFFLFLIKMPSIIADLVTAWGIWYVLKNFEFRISNLDSNLRNRNDLDKPHKKPLPLISKLKFLNSLEIRNSKFRIDLPLLAAFLYIFNPVVIFDSAWWGQTDSVGTALTLISLILLIEGKSLLAAGLSTATIFIKTQFIIFTPFVFLFTLLKEGYKQTVKSLAVSFVAFLIINFPFLLIKRLDSVVSLVTSTVDYFPNVSMNAFNLWWLWAMGKGAVFSDKHLFSGDLTYKTAGLVFFASTFLLATLYIIREINRSKTVLRPRSIGNDFKRERNSLFLTPDSNLALLSPLSFVFAFVGFAFFMLNTQMHERYIFPVFAFTLLWLFSGRFQKSIMRHLLFATCYLLLSLTAFLNLHTVLIWNYPQNGLPLLSNLSDIPFTLRLAFFQTLVFLVFLLYLAFCCGKKLTFSVFLPIVLIFFILGKQGEKRTVPLSTLKPVFWAQEWGKPTKDRSVGNGIPRTGQGFLSSSYFFYKKGIGSHAKSTLTFSLDGKFKSFETDMGIDTEAGDAASVEFEILGDEESLYKSHLLKKWDPIKHAKVDITGKKYLTLKIDNGGDSNYADHADWLNPVLER